MSKEGKILMASFDQYPTIKNGLYDPAFEKDSCGVGVVIDVQGANTHKTVRDALHVLVNLAHRSACCEDIGDGAGILTGIPHEFFVAEAAMLGKSLTSRGEYGVGMIFFNKAGLDLSEAKGVIEGAITSLGLEVLFWRKVPFDEACLAPIAKTTQPIIEQIFIGKGGSGATADEFERKLYLARFAIRSSLISQSVKGPVSASGLISASTALTSIYICTLSSRIIVYKGMLTPEQTIMYFPDLSNELFSSSFALVHSRFSTNTFPSWNRAQPNRVMCHNGEINTVRGNVNWMRAREGSMKSDYLGEALQKVGTVIESNLADSGIFDNVLELLTVAGRDIFESITLMIPEAHQNDELMDPAKRAFYEYNACVMEPWDGPAMIAFTDGRV
jgi:glutamate synthase domain-containing protein 1